MEQSLDLNGCQAVGIRVDTSSFQHSKTFRMPEIYTVDAKDYCTVCVIRLLEKKKRILRGFIEPLK